MTGKSRCEVIFMRNGSEIPAYIFITNTRPDKLHVRPILTRESATVANSPPSGIKPSFSMALICTTRRRIPLSASTNQGSEKGEWVLILGLVVRSFFSSSLLSSLELNDTRVYEPQIRALLDPASHFCEAGVLQSRTVFTVGCRNGPSK